MNNQFPVRSTAASLLISATFAAAACLLLPTHLALAQSNDGDAAPLAASTETPFRSNPALAAQLLTTPTPVAQGNYQVRLPSGFTLRRSRTQGQGAETRSEDEFSMPQDPNGFLPTFAVICRHVDTTASSSPMQYLRAREPREFAGLRAQMQEPTTTAPQYGTINGIPFCRVYYKGIQAVPQKSTFLGMRGFFYEGVDNGTLVTLMALDTQQYGATSVPLAEAAALTFTRR